MTKIEEIEKRLADAKAVTWHTPGNITGYTDRHVFGDRHVDGSDYAPICEASSKPKAEFIASSGVDVRYLLDLVKKQREALEWVKDWFDRLEGDRDPLDPLTAIRQKYHAPVHAKLDAALSSQTGVQG